MSRAFSGDERTVFQPEAPKTATAAGRGGLAAGTLLNNIYEVRRFIARGGMGEVYEGVNVNTDERVAIKVMLPHLAADAKVQAMFRKEARILTELAHPALVRYRVLAQEPNLELFYIVTEFIDGRSLSEMLGEVQLGPTELKALIRRLAEGLGAAHALGAIHRDMSPDNVLVPGGDLSRAKIIDFGIARESSLAHQTVIGDSFAGKLNYVAPEQLGDYGRAIGPWTDIYSMGLVGLALASSAAPDTGVTLVEAVDRRRAGVDLTPLDDSLRPIFHKMLAADPTDRFQSMGELIAALDRLDRPAPKPHPVAAAPGPSPFAAPDEPVQGGSKRWLLGAVAVIALAAVVAGFALSQSKPKAGPIDMHGAPVATAQPETADIVPIAPEVPTVGAGVPSAPVAEIPVTPAPGQPAPAAQPKAKRPVVAKVAAAPVVQVATPVVAAPVYQSAAPAPEPAVQAAQEPAAKGKDAPQACWRAAGSDWAYIGYAPTRAACAAQAFNSCSVVHGRWGKTPLRRYDGKLQGKTGGVIAKWQTITKSDCP